MGKRFFNKPAPQGRSGIEEGEKDEMRERLRRGSDWGKCNAFSLRRRWPEGPDEVEKTPHQSRFA